MGASSHSSHVGARRASCYASTPARGALAGRRPTSAARRSSCSSLSSPGTGAGQRPAGPRPLVSQPGRALAAAASRRAAASARRDNEARQQQVASLQVARPHPQAEPLAQHLAMAHPQRRSCAPNGRRAEEMLRAAAALPERRLAHPMRPLGRSLIRHRLYRLPSRASRKRGAKWTAAATSPAAAAALRLRAPAAAAAREASTTTEAAATTLLPPKHSPKEERKASFEQVSFSLFFLDFATHFGRTHFWTDPLRRARSQPHITSRVGRTPDTPHAPRQHVPLYTQRTSPLHVSSSLTPHDAPACPDSSAI